MTAAGGSVRPALAVGVGLVAAGAVCWSTTGLFVRLAGLDPWTISFWRSLFGAAALGLYLAVARPGASAAAFRSTAWSGAVVVALAAISVLASVAAFSLTTVANVSIIHATLPLIAAGAAWPLVGERPDRWIIASAAMVLLGAFVAFGLSGPGAGDGLALVMTVSMALVAVMIRRHQLVSLLPHLAAATLLAACIAAPFAKPFEANATQLGILLLSALLPIAIGNVLFAEGARVTSAGSAALVSMIETPLAPLWVLLAFGERPSVGALSGGALIMAAVVAHLYRSARPSGRATPAGR